MPVSVLKKETNDNGNLFDATLSSLSKRRELALSPFYMDGLHGWRAKVLAFYGHLLESAHRPGSFTTKLWEILFGLPVPGPSVFS